MANKRMISKDIFDSDKFSNLTSSAVKLYVYLIIAADDDGFVDSVQAVKRRCGCNALALRQLCDKGFVPMFADDLLVIRHWNAMNKMPPSKRRETRYPALLAGLKVGENGAYEVVNKMSH